MHVFVIVLCISASSTLLYTFINDTQFVKFMKPFTNIFWKLFHEKFKFQSIDKYLQQGLFQYLLKSNWSSNLILFNWRPFLINSTISLLESA